MKTSRALQAILVLSSVALAAAGSDAAELRGRISGDGGKPVAHAVIRLLAEPKAKALPGKAARVETAADGTFVSTGLVGQTFRVRVEAKGYAPLTQPDIPAGATVQLRLRPGRVVAGLVKDRATGSPLGAATVLAWDKAAEPFGEDAYRSAKSGKDGRFTVSDLPEGKVEVEARASGRAPARAGPVVVPKRDLELLVDVPGALGGLVTDTSGAPVAGAEVAVSWQAPKGAKRKSVKTGSDGRYRIVEGNTAEVSRMVVRGEKFLTGERDGAAPADGVVDFVLERRGSLTGTVRGYDGKAPATFRVSVRPAPGTTGGKPSEHEFSDPAGAFVVEELDPGTYVVEAAADRYASSKKEDVTIAAEQRADVGTLTLQSKTALRGRVVAARDRVPIAGARVEINRLEGGDKLDLSAASSWSETSGADGTFTTPSLPEGTFDLRVEHPQFVTTHVRVPLRPDTDAPEVLVEMYRGGALTGTVLDGKSEPVAGVRLLARLAPEGEAHAAETGSDGRYFMDGLAVGAWMVTRQKDGPAGSSALDTKLAEIREGETTTLNFDEQPSVLVSGSVLKGQTPMPAASIYFVAIENNRPHDGKSTQADAEGRFQIGLLHGGRYQVSVVFGSAAGSNGHSVVTLNIPDQPEVHQDIVFTEQAIAGHVVDPERRAVKGALVTALRQGTMPGDTPRQATTMTVEDGAFRLEALDAGIYRVTARAKAYASDEAFPVSVGDNEPEADLVLTLRRGWIMHGKFLDPQGRAIAGALVVVAPRGAAESGYLPSQTDATGSFKITAPADGPVSVAAIISRFAPAVQYDVEQPPDGGPSNVVLQGTPGGSMRVRVLHRNGEPVAGVQVAYQPVPLFPGCDVVMDRNRPLPTGADGSTRIVTLYPTTYLVSIPGRRDAAPVQVFVSEGTESDAVIEVP